MDILIEIKDKVLKLPEEFDSTGITSIINHIERAEFFLNIGKTDNDANYFTDVVYRSNQAFEGILKEAYKNIVSKDVDKKTTYQIENYFLRNRILNTRVLDLFKNYRQNWRNPSTHDYKLVFSSDEAFLAIVSVSSFIFVLLDQMIERFSYIKEKKDIEKSSSKIEKKSSVNIRKELIEDIKDLLLTYDSQKHKGAHNESEVLGILTAIFEASGNELNVQREPIFKRVSTPILPDFLIRRGEESLILEVKSGYNIKMIDSAKLQLQNYLSITNVQDGIVFFPNEKSDKYKIENETYEFHNKKYRIIIVHPKN